MPSSETETAEILKKLTWRRHREEDKHRVRGPKPIRNIVAEVMVRRGYGRVQANCDLAMIWREIVKEPFASHSRPGQLRRGVLEVLVTHSVFVQELSSRKEMILAKFASKAPQMKISDLRFRTDRL